MIMNMFFIIYLYVKCHLVAFVSPFVVQFFHRHIFHITLFYLFSLLQSFILIARDRFCTLVKNSTNLFKNIDLAKAFKFIVYICVVSDMS